MALRLEEREDHAAADQELVGLLEQVVDDAELVGDLRAAEDDDVGTLRIDGEPSQHVDLLGDQVAHRRGQPQRDVVDRRLLAVHDAEPVGDERVGQLRELVGERAAHVVVLAGLTLVEADVLEHGDLAVLECLDGGSGALADGVGRERDVLAEQLTEALGHRLEGVRRLRRALGPPEVGDHDDPGSRVGQPLDRGRAGADPAVIGDRCDPRPGER